MPPAPPPSPVDLHNRLIKSEAGLLAVEKALAALFKRINVNRPRDPELDAVLEALATMLHGLEKARLDRSNELEPPRQSCSMSLSAETVMPENDPFGEPEAIRVFTRDAGEKKKVLRAVFPTKEPEN